MTSFDNQTPSIWAVAYNEIEVLPRGSYMGAEPLPIPNLHQSFFMVFNPI